MLVVCGALHRQLMQRFVFPHHTNRNHSSAYSHRRQQVHTVAAFRSGRPGRARWRLETSGTAALRRATPNLPSCEHPRRRRRAKLRPWRVALMRSRTHYLGVVYAADEKAAEAAAIAEYKIGDEQRRRLIVRADD